MIELEMARTTQHKDARATFCTVMGDLARSKSMGLRNLGKNTCFELTGLTAHVLT